MNAYIHGGSAGDWVPDEILKLHDTLPIATKAQVDSGRPWLSLHYTHNLKRQKFLKGKWKPVKWSTRQEGDKLHVISRDRLWLDRLRQD